MGVLAAVVAALQPAESLGAACQQRQSTSSPGQIELFAAQLTPLPVDTEEDPQDDNPGEVEPTNVQEPETQEVDQPQGSGGWNEPVNVCCSLELDCCVVVTK
jgi:hypothetical protein